MFHRKYCITAKINVPIITEVYIVFVFKFGMEEIKIPNLLSIPQKIKMPEKRIYLITNAKFNHTAH